MWLDTRSSRIALILLAAGVSLTLIVRLATSASYLVLGDDTGSYLSTLNFVKGNDLSGNGGTRPPLIGYYLWPFVSVFGELAGAKLAALVASVVGAGGFYLVAKRFVAPLFAAVGGIGFIWLPIYAETLGWGFLSILVIGIALLAMWSWIRYAEKPGLDRALAATAITLIVTYLNQTATPVMVAIIVSFLVFHILMSPKTHLPYLIPAGLLAVVLGLGSVPYSMAHLAGEMIPATDGATGGIGFKIKDPVTLSIAVISCGFFAYAGRKIGGPAGVFIMLGGIMTSISQSVTVPASLGLITILGRTILWFWMFFALAGLWTINQLFNRVTSRLSLLQVRTYATALMVVGIIYLGMSWTLRLDSVMPYYTTLNQDSVNALGWIKENTEPDEKVAVYPLPLAFHTNGIANRQTISTGPEDGDTGEMLYDRAIKGKVYTQDRAVRCTLGYVTECYQFLPDLGARYLLTRAEVDLPVAFSSGDIKVYRVATQ